MKSLPLIIGVIVLFGGVAYFMTNNSSQNQEALSTSSNETKSLVTPTTENNEVTSPNAETTNESLEATEVARIGTYTTYNAKKITESSADHIFLFFHATWCPSCRALDKDILTNRDAIPSGVEIYKIDYDTSIELKKKYGVTTQHSLIEIASDGTAKSSITHPATLADVLKTI